MAQRDPIDRPSVPSDTAADHARIEQLERQVAGLTNVLGSFAIAPLASQSRAQEMIGFAALPFSSDPPASMNGGDMKTGPSSEERARFVRDHIRQRRARADIFPADFFSDPVWDMLLDLYAAHYEGHSVSVSSLCIAAAVPATTALRWIKTLTAKGIFVRSRDEHDGRRVYVDLSQDALQSLDRYFDGLQGRG